MRITKRNTLAGRYCFTALTAAALLSPAVAQTKVCIGGSLDQLTSAERASCSAKAQSVRVAASSLHAPENWHFIVVCDAQGWQDYTAYQGLSGTSTVSSHGIMTNLEQRETVLRGDAEFPNEPAVLRDLVTAELHKIDGAHVVLAENVHGQSPSRSNSVGTGF